MSGFSCAGGYCVYWIFPLGGKRHWLYSFGRKQHENQKEGWLKVANSKRKWKGSIQLVLLDNLLYNYRSFLPEPQMTLGSMVLIKTNKQKNPTDKLHNTLGWLSSAVSRCPWSQKYLVRKNTFFSVKIYLHTFLNWGLDTVSSHRCRNLHLFVYLLTDNFQSRFYLLSKKLFRKSSS